MSRSGDSQLTDGGRPSLRSYREMPTMGEPTTTPPMSNSTARIGLDIAGEQAADQAAGPPLRDGRAP